MLVLDASAALGAAQFRGGFSRFRGQALVGPPLLWSEFVSALHEALWRGEVSAGQAERTRRTFERAGIERQQPVDLYDEAWRTAEALGWAKTYDAEFVALARLLECRLVTGDLRLRRGTDHLGFVITPGEL